MQKMKSDILLTNQTAAGITSSSSANALVVPGVSSQDSGTAASSSSNSSTTPTAPYHSNKIRATSMPPEKNGVSLLLPQQQRLSCTTKTTTSTSNEEKQRRITVHGRCSMKNKNEKSYRNNINNNRNINRRSNFNNFNQIQLPQPKRIVVDPALHGDIFQQLENCISALLSSNSSSISSDVCARHVVSLQELTTLICESMSHPHRCYHRPEHVLDIIVAAHEREQNMQGQKESYAPDPILALAALFHDVVYYQVDGAFSVQQQKYMYGAIEKDKGVFLIPEHSPKNKNQTDNDDDDDELDSFEEEDVQLLEMVQMIFGVEVGQTLTPLTGLNEYLSAVVAVRVLHASSLWRKPQQQSSNANATPITSSDANYYLTWSHLADMAACIEATIPFRMPHPETKVTPMEKLYKNLFRAYQLIAPLQQETTANGCTNNNDTHLIAAVQRAARMNNRDVGNFAFENHAEFLAHTWSLLPETNPTLRRPQTDEPHQSSPRMSFSTSGSAQRFSSTRVLLLKQQQQQTRKPSIQQQQEDNDEDEDDEPSSPILLFPDPTVGEMQCAMFKMYGFFGFLKGHQIFQHFRNVPPTALYNQMVHHANRNLAVGRRYLGAHLLAYSVLAAFCELTANNNNNNNNNTTNNTNSLNKENSTATTTPIITDAPLSLFLGELGKHARTNRMTRRSDQFLPKLVTQEVEDRERQGGDEELAGIHIAVYRILTQGRGGGCGCFFDTKEAPLAAYLYGMLGGKLVEETLKKFAPMYPMTEEKASLLLRTLPVPVMRTVSKCITTTMITNKGEGNTNDNINNNNGDNNNNTAGGGGNENDPISSNNNDQDDQFDVSYSARIRAVRIRKVEENIAQQETSRWYFM